MVRAATIDDAAALSVLHHACFTPRGERAWPQSEWLDLLKSAQHHCLLIEQHGLIKAALLVQIAGDEADIVTIMTAPDHRKAGHAATLLRAFTAHAVNIGLARLLLEVAADNDAARHLYAAAGYQEVGKRARYYKKAGAERVDALVLCYHVPTR